MPNYTFATLTDAQNAVAARLYDPTFQQWTQSELTGYITEALRTWNALTGFWRAEMVFSLSLNSQWYDLRQQSGSLIPFTVQQYDIITQIENHLLEPATPAAWSGSTQFSLSDILSACQRRQDETLGVTACTINRSVVNAPLGGRIILADNVIDIRRVAWFPTSGFGFSNKTLRQSDFFGLRAYSPTYTTAVPQPPSMWMQNAEPPPSFDVDLVPPVIGQYEVLTVPSGPAWVAGTNAGLNIPDDWTWVFKWGALADLLNRESNAKDSLRAQYCEKRYRQGLALLESMAVSLALRLNNIPMAIDAVSSADKYRPLWQNGTGAPTSAYMASDLIAFSPTPDSSTAYSATVSVVQNAPVPTNSGSFIQVSREDFDTIIDISQHLAMFKHGGSEFAATMPLWMKAVEQASLYNGKLKEMGFFEQPMSDLGQLEEIVNPRYLKGTAPQA